MDGRPVDVMSPLAGASGFPVDVRIPRTAKLLEILEPYKTPDKVQCGLEGCRTPHNRGFLVLFAECDGAASKVGMVGHICGKHNFDASWTAAELVYDVRVRTAELEAAKERFRIRAGRILPELQAAAPRTRTLIAARGVLTKHAPEVMRVCADAAKSQGGQVNIYSDYEIRLAGVEFWRDGGTTLLGVLRLHHEVDKFLQYLASPEATKREVDRQIGGFANIEHQWQSASKTLQAAEAALQPGHLQDVFEAVRRIQKHTSIPGVERDSLPDGYFDLRVRIRGSVLEHSDWNGRNRVWVRAVDLGEPETGLLP